jgi:hypothetical protein
MPGAEKANISGQHISPMAEVTKAMDSLKLDKTSSNSSRARKQPRITVSELPENKNSEIVEARNTEIQEHEDANDSSQLHAGTSHGRSRSSSEPPITPERPPNPRKPASDTAQSPLFKDISENLRVEMRDNFENCVYIFISTKETDLVKIGVSAKPLERKRQIEKCTCGCDFGDLDFYEKWAVSCPKKIESLVHLELENYRYKCLADELAATPTKKKGGRRPIDHHEWFSVPPEVAKKSVERWLKFFKAAYTSAGLLDTSWHDHVEKIPQPTPYEKNCFLEGKHADNHRLRHQKLQKWLSKGLSLNPKLSDDSFKS